MLHHIRRPSGGTHCLAVCSRGGGGGWISGFRHCQPDLSLEGSPSRFHLAVSAAVDNAWTHDFIEGHKIMNI